MLLTQRAQSIVGQYLQPGQQVVDATAGNGHDSCFLARQVGARGRVFVFDIQQQALNSTASRLRDQGQAAQVTLVHRGHEHLLDEIPAMEHGRIQAVMFNLGYLPHGDKSRTTTSATTLPALTQARAVLAPGGIISVLAYRRHPGGQEETQAVEQQLRRLASGGLQLSVIPSPGPVLFVLAPERHD